MGQFYDMFVRDVGKGRKVSVTAVRNGFGQGRTVLSPDAVSSGLADRVGTLNELVMRVGQGKVDRRRAQVAVTRAKDGVLDPEDEPLTVALEELGFEFEYPEDEVEEHAASEEGAEPEAAPTLLNVPDALLANPQNLADMIAAEEELEASTRELEAAIEEGVAVLRDGIDAALPHDFTNAVVDDLDREAEATEKVTDEQADSAAMARKHAQRLRLRYGIR